MCRIVRARVHAARFSVIVTQVARCRLHPHAGDLSARVSGVVGLDRERMQVDVPVRTVVGAQAAANAPVLDDDLE